MNITDLLDRPIAYHRIFVTLTGSVKAAILLSQAMYWQKRAKQADGWWYKTAEEWQEETGLSRHEQDTARIACAEYLKTDLRDAPARLYWKLDLDALSEALFAESGHSSLAESGKLDSRKAANINRNAENTTENTTVSLTPKELEQANRKVTAIIENARKAKYPHREKFPEVLTEYADLYVELTGQEPQKKALMDWIETFDEWQGQGIRAAHIREAFKRLSDSGIVVARPGSLTKTAYALKSAQKARGKEAPAQKTDLERFMEERRRNGN